MAVASPLAVAADEAREGAAAGARHEPCCAHCFRALGGAACACAGCGARYCSGACRDAAGAGAHGVLCGPEERTLNAFCLEHSLNFPRAAAAALALSLAAQQHTGGREFGSYWAAVNSLASLTLGPTEALPASFAASYGLMRRAVGARLGGDTEAFFGAAFPLRAYARLMGTLRLNAFSVACPIDRPAQPQPQPAPAPLVPPVLAPAPPGAAAAAAAAAPGAAAPATSDAAGCCSTDGADAGAPSCGGEEASACASGGDAGSVLRAAERAPGAGTALYESASLLNHSCEPNLGVALSPGAHLSLFASRDIAAGEELTISYVDAALDVDTRRRALRHGYGF